MMPELYRQNAVFVLDLGSDGNSFLPAQVDQTDRFLDEVIAAPPPRALVSTGRGRFYSSGLDLDWLAANADQIPEFAVRGQALLAKLITLPLPTVAALNGHAYGVGAVFALAHDWRVMRPDQGYVCLPEV